MVAPLRSIGGMQPVIKMPKNLSARLTYSAIEFGNNAARMVQVNYKNVMSEYRLGPNGGILTACNLFATRFDQVMTLLEQPRDPALETVVLDTAGQIEIFTWSASGSIVTELLASSFSTVVLYVIDTPRCLSPQTFMSNMMQACSILYKTRLPMVLVCSYREHRCTLQMIRLQGFAPACWCTPLLVLWQDRVEFCSRPLHANHATLATKSLTRCCRPLKHCARCSQPHQQPVHRQGRTCTPAGVQQD